MKKNKNFIPAFTILEIAISLAIMSIIIAMVYVIYSLLSKQLYDYDRLTQQVNNYQELNTVFTRDIAKSFDINYQENILYCNTNNGVIRYNQYQDKLIRKFGETIDTFQVSINSFNPNKEDFLLNRPTKRIEIEYELFNQKINGFYHKNFGVAPYINATFFIDGN